jgi:hypothetical protein
LQRGREAGRRSADDGDVAMALDGAVCMFTHGFDDTVSPIHRKTVCDIRKNVDGGVRC